jgi:L-alanine-DL-glutamate epimerase-like enolase superfamily enzyme
MPLSLSVRIERFPLANTFSNARGQRSEATVVVAELSDGSHRGRGECVPNPRYGKTPDDVASAITAMAGPLAHGLDRIGLQSAMPAGAARNALDCAFWDLEAKRSNTPCYILAGLPKPLPLVTAYTISLGTPEIMARAAEAAASRPLLKLKLGGNGDVDRIRAVRRAAPKAELIADANEAWDATNLTENLAACGAAGVTLVEQPLPASDDAVLATTPRTIAICADESLQDSASVSQLVGKYDAVNIKLDKAGGLTEGLNIAATAERAGMVLMVGCMLGTSLAMAPALLLAQRARVVDLDGPLLLAADRKDGLRYDGSLVHPPEPAFWG